MARPLKSRCCRSYRADRVYKPQGIPMRDVALTELSLDQFEALRLCDVERLDQAAAGLRMGVSRGTVQRLLYSGRQKLVAAILRRDAILINLSRPETSGSGRTEESEADHAGVHSDQG